ncbi:helix-turn-helix domain-containing protein [Streptomyces sp. NPDC088733]|uniref:helix-turn-helix domain-containing protein n=1 Tax=Streptomyces sp. NPDC088733 TaxID=3365880 RepID=UPI0037FD2D61
MSEPEHNEDFAQLIQRLKDEYDVNESEIARRLGVSPATVNTWTQRQRKAPRAATLEKISEVFPKFTRDEIFAAAARRTPGPLSKDATERLLAYYAQLTEEQQRAKLVEMKALAEDNRL